MPRPKTPPNINYASTFREFQALENDQCYLHALRDNGGLIRITKMPENLTVLDLDRLALWARDGERWD